MSNSVDQVTDVTAAIVMNGSYSDSVALLSDRSTLLNALSNQLVYYFSPANLLKDTFLTGAMNFNSGCVPIEILANFSNIQRMIATFYSNYPHVYEQEDFQNLLCHAACGTDNARQYLRVIVVDQFGRFVAKFGEEYISSGELTYSLAIGPSLTTPPLESPPPSSNETAVKSNIVILRDVSDQATEDDIRAVFTHPSSTVIKSIQKDVEHCWFVTLDAMTTKDEVFSILSNLRTKSIRGEPVKARLKTQSITSPSASLDPSKVVTDSGITSTTVSLPPSIGRKPSDGQVAQGSTHIGKHSYPPGNKMHHQPKHHHQHTTDAVTERSQVRKPAAVKEIGGSKSQRNHGRNKRGSHNSANSDANGKERHDNGGNSLSQLGEKDFPSLSTISSTKATINVSHEHDAEKSKDVDSSSSPNIPSKVVSGYAAALLKPAPINPPIPLTSASSSANIESKTPAKESNSGTASSRSSGTAPTDDSSADDKSMSSKPDSDKGGNGSSSPSTSTLNTSSPWSKNVKSFADVLKKQD